MIFERTVAEIAGDYAVLVSESGTRTEVALGAAAGRYPRGNGFDLRKL